MSKHVLWELAELIGQVIARRWLRKRQFGNEKPHGLLSPQTEKSQVAESLHESKRQGGAAQM